MLNYKISVNTRLYTFNARYYLSPITVFRNYRKYDIARRIVFSSIVFNSLF